MKAASTFETSVASTRLQGATSQTKVTFMREFFEKITEEDVWI
jgi:hypothetical protein